MFLSRFDALLLHKVLFHYEKIVNSDESFGQVLDDISVLNEKLEEYLLNEPGQAVSVSTQDKVDECSSEDDYDDEDDLDEDLEEEAKDELPEAKMSVAGSLLHDLPSIDTDLGVLEFEEDEDEDESQVNLLVDGDFCGDDAVLLIKRNGKIIEVWSTTGEKFVFELKKLNKDWKKIFVDGLVYKVVND